MSNARKFLERLTDIHIVMRPRPADPQRDADLMEVLRQFHVSHSRTEPNIREVASALEAADGGLPAKYTNSPQTVVVLVAIETYEETDVQTW
jgi:hypothetical protein